MGVKQIGSDGAVVGERRFIGLFTSRVYSLSVTDIPMVRHKVEAVLAQTGDQASSHDRATLLSILESYPRDELFDADVADLARIAEGILHLRDRRRVKLFMRPDTYGRFISCMVFVPRDRYTTEVRRRIQGLLLDELGGTDILFDSQVSGAALARAHVTVFTGGRQRRAVDVAELEARIAEIARDWTDDLRTALVEARGEAAGLALHERYARAFPSGYREQYRAAVAVSDIDRLEQLRPGELSVDLYRPLEADERAVRLKVFRVGEPITLSDVLPLLHDLGVTVMDERPYDIRSVDGRPASVYDFGLRLPSDAHAIEDRGGAFERAFLAGWEGRCESDGFNRLVLTAGLDWREVVVLRAYRRYLRQVGSTFSQAYYESTLNRHPAIARLIVDAFAARLDPSRDPDRRATDLARVRREIEAALQVVPVLDEDRMLSSFVALVDATVRTNFFQRDGESRPRPALALKLDTTSIPDLPLPCPEYETFVYSPAVEGTHLRMARVARGGIRWSDRREDFRTEILHLMKAQTVKNAVIVPAGAKGGFVAKRLGPRLSGEQSRAEVLTAYRLFISSLLQITDNLVRGQVLPPDDVVRLDGDDPYLVVAADKGTATFSDIANEISLTHGFWLGDAFASGGSSGYDHKAMGITAKGAWESVRRHFRELGVDTQREPISVVGIGDMSGDVFGNGMLLSPRLRLIGAFDHRHVFIDPDPDPERSFAERRRLFELPRSSWADFERSVLSEGGGVFTRSAKSVPVSAQMREALDLPDDTLALTPPQLVRALLTAPVDLLWNGGIGTFVRASHETDADVNDRTNDAVRVEASELRSRVVGEGGNLGLTTLARVEFARAGGRIYSDAIDNSAGVNCSDHEVNLKILLDDAVADGDLTLKQRNALLVDMTADVCTLVLAENYRQTGAIAAAQLQAPSMVEVHKRHLAWLERSADLDRTLEGLPSDEELNERRENGNGLSAPELAILLAYTKIRLTDDLIESDVPDDPTCRALLTEYFPLPVRNRFPDRITTHPLARELTATLLANRLVDRAGLSMTHRLAEETSAPTGEIARAHLASWTMFELGDAWRAIDELDNRVPAEVQLLMQLETKRLGERGTRWLLRNCALPLEVAAVTHGYGSDINQIGDLIPDFLSDGDRQAVRRTLDAVQGEGVPTPLAVRVAHMDIMITALDIIEIHRETGAPLDRAAAAYLSLDDDLGLDWLRQRINGLARNDRWESLARSALRDDFFRAQRDLTVSILGRSGDDQTATDDLVASWIGARHAAVEHCTGVLADIRTSGRNDLAQLSVGVRELRNLIQVTNQR